MQTLLRDWSYIEDNLLGDSNESPPSAKINPFCPLSAPPGSQLTTQGPSSAAAAITLDRN